MMLFRRVRRLCLVLAAVPALRGGGWGARGQATATQVQPADQTSTPPQTPPPQTPPAQTPPAQTPPAAHGKAKKAAYTGPDEIVVLPPTPMLDEEGKQRLDPDGKPMFNPPVEQQRDKKGHPLFDEHGKPVMQTEHDLGYDEHGKKIRVKKEKPPKMTPVTISRGTFTVDGVIGKAALNYDIPDLKFLYMYVPGIGVAVVSKEPFVGATEEKSAFNGNSLVVQVEGHTLEVASDQPLLGKKAKPASGYVLLDRAFGLPTQYPAVGYGPLLKAPYAWPGSKANGQVTGPVQPPPLPENLRPVQLLAACPAGQMRKPAPQGQTAAEQPCVPISAAQAPVPAQPVGSSSAPKN